MYRCMHICSRHRGHGICYRHHREHGSPWAPSRAWKFHARDGAHGIPWTSAGPWIPWTSVCPWVPWKTAIYRRHGFHGKRQSTGGTDSMENGNLPEARTPWKTAVYGRHGRIHNPWPRQGNHKPGTGLGPAGSGRARVGPSFLTGRAGWVKLRVGSGSSGRAL
jgi:hypothetical protein